MKPCILVGSDKGGVGKSFLSEIIITAYDQASDQSSETGIGKGSYYPLRVIEIDHQRRLYNLMGDRINLSLDAFPGMEDIVKDKSVAETYFNRIYDFWASGPSLTDMGANVTSTLFSWAKFFDIMSYAKEDGIQFRFISVATPDDQSMKSALSSLKSARDTFGDGIDLFLVFNDVQGSFGYKFFENSEIWSRLNQIASQMNITIIRIPFCSSLFMEWGRAQNHTIKDTLKNGLSMVDAVALSAGVDKLTARIEYKKFLEWVGIVQNEMRPLFSKVKKVGVNA